MRRLALLPLLGLVFTPALLRADDADKALEKLQGTWNVVKYVNDGKDESPEADSPEIMTVKGAHYDLKRKADSYRGDLKVDATKSPGTIDATFYDTEDKQLGEALGIYKLAGDEWTVVWNDGSDERPKTFSAEKGSRNRMIVLKKK
jgi:uncharacterized protein (TIGR03067 family)